MVELDAGFQRNALKPPNSSLLIHHGCCHLTPTLPSSERPRSLPPAASLLSLRRRARRPSPHLIQLRLTQIPQLIRRGRLARHDPLGDLDRAADQILAADGILRRGAGDLDDADAGVLGPAVVRAVAQVAEPGLEPGRVVLADFGAVGEDAGFARDRGPLARGVEEAEVDFRVRFEVVGFAGLGVGVEDEVDAVAFLWAGRDGLVGESGGG